jgi:hypothetical protein
MIYQKEKETSEDLVNVGVGIAQLVQLLGCRLDDHGSISGRDKRFISSSYRSDQF